MLGMRSTVGCDPTRRREACSSRPPMIVPLDSHLEIEAMLSNRDIGFVSAGQEAEIKVDTFTFTRYGLLHGRVLNVSQDAITRDKSQEKSSDQTKGVDTSTSEPKGQELVYSARVSLDS